MQVKTLSTKVEADGGQIVAKLTTDSVDRDGEVLIPQGMNTVEFDKNPVLFYNHEYDQPIGKVTRIKRTENAVTGVLEFAQRPEGYEGDFFPSFIEALVRQDIVKGVSVGFVAESGGSRLASKADRAKFGPRIKRVFNKWKLLEVSIAPLPANQDALITAVGKGLVTPMQCKRFLGCDIEESRPKVVLRRKHRIELTAPKCAKQEIQKSVERTIAKKMGKLF
tara:strand:+ start:1521 stop:2186 length:666 start_codon:yes stop_codon:yes gene_type:complete